MLRIESFKGFLFFFFKHAKQALEGGKEWICQAVATHQEDDCSEFQARGKGRHLLQRRETKEPPSPWLWIHGSRFPCAWGPGSGPCGDPEAGPVHLLTNSWCSLGASYVTASHGPPPPNAMQQRPHPHFTDGELRLREAVGEV